MNTLILNVGSSSIKYVLFKNGEVAITKYVERVKNFKKVLNEIFNSLSDIKIDAVGHRVVHGGKEEKTTLINKKILTEIKKYSELASLHNPYELEAIKISMQHYKVPQVAIFDTAFHQTIPEKAYTYAIPQRFTKKYRIRRYGFHGSSHSYVAKKTSEIMKKPLNKLKIITCHLGNGCSIAAINKGKSVETSMGFTPLEGLVMGTRCGDIDPSIIPYLEKKEKLSSDKINYILNHESGLFGISGISQDVRDLHKSEKGKLAIEVFCHRLTKYIGAYAAVLGGIDAITFTAGIGENAYYIREKVLKNFEFLGLNLDKKRNKKNEPVITKNNSKIKAFVIKTDEAKVMLEEMEKVL